MSDRNKIAGGLTTAGGQSLLIRYTHTLNKPLSSHYAEHAFFIAYRQA